MPNTQLIKDRMSEKGIAQKDIAEALGIAAPTVSQKIKGVRPMNLDEARTMAAMLGIESGEFGRFFLLQELRNATSSGVYSRLEDLSLTNPDEVSTCCSSALAEEKPARRTGRTSQRRLLLSRRSAAV